MKVAWADPGKRAAMKSGQRQRMMAEQGRVACAKCGELKGPDEYPSGRKARNGQKRYAYCKACHREYQRLSTLRRVFNMTPADYDLILDEQGKACGICRRPPGKTRLAVDHCHRTGLIRGLVCWRCNRAIAIMQDNAELHDRAARYLRLPPAIIALRGERFGRPGRVSNKASTVRRLLRAAQRVA